MHKSHMSPAVHQWIKYYYEPFYQYTTHLCRNPPARYPDENNYSLNAVQSNVNRFVSNMNPLHILSDSVTIAKETHYDPLWIQDDSFHESTIQWIQPLWACYGWTLNHCWVNSMWIHYESTMNLSIQYNVKSVTNLLWIHSTVNPGCIPSWILFHPTRIEYVLIRHSLQIFYDSDMGSSQASKLKSSWISGRANLQSYRWVLWILAARFNSMRSRSTIY